MIKLFLVALCLPALAATPPSLPEIRNVTDDYYGVQVDDPFRYFEDRSNAEVDAWSRASAAVAHEALSTLPIRQKVSEIIDQTTEAQGDEVSDIQRARGERLYFLMRKQGENQPKLYRKKPHQQAKLILDPATLAPDAKDPSIKYFSVSPDERHLAVCLTSGGSENGILQFLNLATGEPVDEAIDRSRWGPGSWLDDGSGYFYSRLQKLGTDADRQETFQRSIIYFHRLGTPTASDLPIYGIGVNEEITVAPSDISASVIVPGSGWMVVFNGTGVSADYILHMARVDDILEGTPNWREITTRRDLVGAFRGGSLAIMGDELLLITRKDAPNGKIVRIDLKDPDFSNAELVYAPEQGVLQQLLHTAEGLYVRVLDGGPSRIFRLPKDAMDSPKEIQFPEQGRLTIHGDMLSDPRLDGMILTMNSWTRPSRYFRVDPESRTAEPIRLGDENELPISSQLVSYQIKVPSHDGVEVPVSITHRKDLDKHTTHPVMLTAYGAYGITIEPRFYPSDSALYALGGIKAVAHVRGGGANGDAWRLAGYQATKPNTWKDLIAAAEGLVEQGLSTPSQIGIMGGSAGGITVGRAITEKPEAFGAAIINVGVCDAIRMETTPNGVPNIPEFGSTKTKNGFHALHAMSAYHHVADGTAYPPTLICHGANDTRVELWQSQKMAARMMHAATDETSVLLRIDYHAGHGGGSSVKQANALYGDMVAFVLENCRR